MGSFDIVVVGGGIVGLTLALALSDSELKVAVIEAGGKPAPLSDTPALRVSAINLASQTLFNALGVWQQIEAQRSQPYGHMQVWEQDSFASINFDKQQVHQPRLGTIIENDVIINALWEKLSAISNVSLLTDNKINKLVRGQRESFITLEDDSMLTARLVVGADGGNSFVRQKSALPITFWDYDQSSIVATVKTRRPHEQCARQVFTPDGPLAFLPLYEPDLCSIVWSVHHDNAADLMALDDQAFSKALTVAFDARLGVCELHSERRQFPLKMRYARQWVSDRVALVGDAAHTIHPLAGQGANLGLMDAAALAQTIMQLNEKGLDFGLAQNLRSYERWRKTEAAKMVAAMEGFKRLFEGAHPAKKLLRDMGLALMERMPLAKDKIIEQAMGLSGDLPRLAR